MGKISQEEAREGKMEMETHKEGYEKRKTKAEERLGKAKLQDDKDELQELIKDYIEEIASIQTKIDKYCVKYGLPNI